ncbi:dihydropteridine reductase-like isoform 1-T4 [Glossina fuscipes fuscipes]|uniref:Dihydropteridine reductase n=1 Tax=Glossina palpalis gambiensis TaxID=67801 RepID=A0A1B0ARS0_9MUSC
MMSLGRVLIYGGKGALGAACVSHFKENNFWVSSVDFNNNEQADAGILVSRNASWIEQEEDVLKKVGAALGDNKLDAVICVAGGWAGGNAKTGLAKMADTMWRQSVWTSTISATIAANHLKPEGLLALTGAKLALEGTPDMIGYGLAKAGVHQLTRSLAAKNSGIPDDAVVVSILPITLDTPTNRKIMPNADFSSWTPLKEIAAYFHQWTKQEERPKSGSLLQVVTENGSTYLSEF